MATTIVFDPISLGSHYTIDELNTLFSDLAVVINGKLDTDSPVVGASELQLNFQRITNLGEGTDDEDAISVGQAKELLGLS